MDVDFLISGPPPARPAERAFIDQIASQTRPDVPSQWRIGELLQFMELEGNTLDSRVALGLAEIGSTFSTLSELDDYHRFRLDSAALIFLTRQLMREPASPDVVYASLARAAEELGMRAVDPEATEVLKGFFADVGSLGPRPAVFRMPSHVINYVGGTTLLAFSEYGPGLQQLTYSAMNTLNENQVILVLDLVHQAVNDPADPGVIKAMRLVSQAHSEDFQVKFSRGEDEVALQHARVLTRIASHFPDIQLSDLGIENCMVSPTVQILERMSPGTEWPLNPETKRWLIVQISELNHAGRYLHLADKVLVVGADYMRRGAFDVFEKARSGAEYAVAIDESFAAATSALALYSASGGNPKAELELHDFMQRPEFEALRANETERELDAYFPSRNNPESGLDL